MGAFLVDESIGYWISLVSRSLRNDIRVDLTEYGLYPGQDLLLMSLWGQDGQTQTQLSQNLQIQQATLSRMIQRMEKSDLVRRRPVPSDKRISKVYLSNKGRDLLEPIESIWQDLEQKAFKGFSLEERLLLRRLLMQLHAHRAET